MQRRTLNKTLPFVLFASGCALVLGAASACSDTPASPSQSTAGTSTTTSGTGPGTSGTGGTPSTGGSITTGGTTPTAGTATGGTGVVPTAGTGGTAAGGTSGGVGGGGGSGGTVPAGGSGPACKAVTPINGSGLTVSATDVSAFKFANSPPGTMTKMAYDPVGKVIVVLGQDGKMYSTAEPTIPTTMTTTPLSTLAAYDAGYTPDGQNKDHRGIVFGPDGTLYVLAVRGGGDVGVTIRKGVPGAGGGARTWSNLVTTSQGFPAGGTNFDHSFSGIAISPDGMSLYFSSGSRSDHGEKEGATGEVPLSSAIFKVPTATPTVLSNDMTALAPVMFADGTRNSFDMAFNAAGDLIGTENGPDMDLPDEVNWLQQGKHYGFPFRFGAVNNPVGEAGYTATGDKRLHPGYQAVDQNKYVYDATLAPPAGQAFVDPILNKGPAATVARADRNADPAPVAAGLAGVTGHRSPLGIAFDTGGVLCGQYYKQGFMLSYGALKSDSLGDGGNDLLLLTLTKGADSYTMTANQLAKGIQAPMDSVLVGNKLYTVGFGGAPLYVFVFPTP